MKSLSNIKIVFCDIDGTLVDDNKVLSMRTIESIKRVVAKGIYVVLVSGRDYFHVMNKVKALGASPILVSSGGALVYDMEHERAIYADRISIEKVKEIVSFCNKHKLGVLVRALQGKYYNDYITMVYPDDAYRYVKISENTDFDNIYTSQILIEGDSIPKTMVAKAFVSSLDLEITNYSSSFLEKIPNKNYYFDVNNKNVSKGPAVTYLLEYLNIKKEDSICFGDFLNDLDMFDACGFSVAMDNATYELRQKADFVTLSNNEDGVADFLDKYL